MSTHLTTCHLANPAATTRWATAWGRVLTAGDVVLLSGGIGAGKTHFARGLIQSRLAVAEDVPSPTFTLVQVYDTPTCEVWHCDLYRLTDPSEVFELGLEEAMETALCLIEWPDRMGSLTPSSALGLHFAPSADGHTRDVTVTGDPARWAERLVDCPT